MAATSEPPGQTPGTGTGSPPSWTKLGVADSTPPAQRLDQGGAILHEAEERPGALAVPLHQPSLHQQLEMARDARLRLAQDIGQIGNRELAGGQECEDAQTRLLGRCPQDGEGVRER